MENPTAQGELSHRQRSVLLATVQEFIATAEPVGSQQIAARYPLGVRAAMVRNLTLFAAGGQQLLASYDWLYDWRMR